MPQSHLPSRTPLLGAVVLDYGPGRRYLPLVERLIVEGLEQERCVVVHNPAAAGEDAPLPAPDGVVTLRMSVNRGYGSGMNAGLRHLDGKGVDFTLLLTHETRLGEGALAALLDATRDPSYGVLGFVLQDEGSRSGLSFGGMYERGRVTHIERLPAHGAERVLDVPWVDGSAMALRMEAWRRVGPLAERYFMYFEEAELCARVRTAGWKVGTVLGARATSAAGGSRRPGAYGYLYARNGFDWARRAGGWSTALRFARSQLSSAVQTVASATRRHLRDSGSRNALYATAGARLVGLVDAVRGRFGPPPRWVARSSDIAGAWPEED